MQGRKEKKNQLFPTTSWLQSAALTLEWLSSSYRHNTDLLRQQTQDNKAGGSFWYPSLPLHSFRNFCRSVSGNPFCWYFFWKAHSAVRVWEIVPLVNNANPPLRNETPAVRVQIQEGLSAMMTQSVSSRTSEPERHWELRTMGRKAPENQPGGEGRRGVLKRGTEEIVKTRKLAC